MKLHIVFDETLYNRVQQYPPMHDFETSSILSPIGLYVYSFLKGNTELLMILTMNSKFVKKISSKSFC